MSAGSGGLVKIVRRTTDLSSFGRSFESKRRVETYIKSNLPDLALTILRPTYFMVSPNPIPSDSHLLPADRATRCLRLSSQDNLGATSNGGFGSPRWLGTSSAMRYNFSDESKTIQMIATSDIGRAAAMGQSPTLS